LSHRHFNLDDLRLPWPFLIATYFKSTQPPTFSTTEYYTEVHLHRVLARSKKKSVFTWYWEIYFSLKLGISLWVWGHAVAPSRFLKFLCLWNGISHILGVILSKCSCKHVFNGVLTTYWRQDGWQDSALVYYRM
jgi:hypothetical protein